MHSDRTPTYTARYSDGHGIGRAPAIVRLTDDGLAFRMAGTDEALWPYADIRTAEPLRKRSLDAIVMARGAGHASLFVDDTVLLSELSRRSPHILIHRERWRAARPGLAVGLVGFACFGVVWAADLSPAKGIATTMPYKARQVLGDSVIRTMPAHGRCSTPEGQAALGRLVRRILPQGPMTESSITVLDWSLVNAFAVPGDKLVLTRGLLDRAQSADEIAGIIGHEAGHVAELHPETSLVRSVGFWALVQMVFTGTPGAVGNIGVVLAQLVYTRSAERVADMHAIRLLRDAAVSPKGLADFFRRMDAEWQSKSGSPNRIDPLGKASDIFSSHPSNAERLSFIDQQPAYPSTPALADDDWQALKHICSPAKPKGAPERLPTPQPVEEQARGAAAKATAERAQAELKAQADRVQAEKAQLEKAQLEKAQAEKLEAEREEAARIARQRAETARAASAKAEADRLAMEAARKPPVDLRDNAPAGAAEPAAEQKVASATPPAPAHASPSAQTAPVPSTVQANPSPLDARVAAATKRISVNGSDAAAFYERGQAYAAKRENGLALEDFSRVIALKPTETPAFFWRASVFTQMKDLDRAIADYTEVLRLQPKNYAALNNRGSLYRSQKKLDLAFKDYSAAVAIDGRQVVALTNRALIHRDRGNLDAALADLNAALTTNPNYVHALVRRGETYELRSARDRAIADYKAALKVPEPVGSGSEPHATARARLAALGAGQ